MSLTELIAGVEAEEKTLTVYNADDAVEELRERFADRNVAVEAGHAEAGPERFLVLGHDGKFLAATGIDALLERPDPESPGFEDDPYRPILDHLDETTFTSCGRRKMLLPPGRSRTGPGGSVRVSFTRASSGCRRSPRSSSPTSRSASVTP